MEIVKKMIDDRVYPCFEMKIPGYDFAFHYFDWRLKTDFENFHFRDCPNSFAYYEQASELTKYKRQKIFAYYERIKDYYEKEKGCELKELKFHRIRKEIYEQEMYATLNELDADPRAEEEWR